MTSFPFVSLPFSFLLASAKFYLQLFAQRGGFEIDERSANYIFHLSGHTGIIGSILKSMYEHAKNFELDGIYPSLLLLSSSYLPRSLFLLEV
jgi:hypothetical protein